MDKPRCQSCGMPLGAAGYYGTNSDGSENPEYCKFCYQNGVFTQPDQTVEGMIKSSVDFMTENLKMPLKTSQEMSHKIIPQLKRWKKIKSE